MAGSTHPSGVVDGPLPSHYEPQDSPIRNPLYPSHSRNPARGIMPRPENLYHPDPAEPGNEDAYPFVVTTYRLTEHFTAGGMTRWTPYLSELQPEFFCEISPQLAELRGIEHGGWATIVTARNAIEARVLVTAPDRAAAGGRPDDPPDRPALPLGSQRSEPRATRPTSSPRSRWIRRRTSRRTRP